MILEHLKPINSKYLRRNRGRAHFGWRVMPENRQVVIIQCQQTPPEMKKTKNKKTANLVLGKGYENSSSSLESTSFTGEHHTL